MREFFRGWRRKVGCATLVTACALMVGWLRSCVVCEVVYFASGARQHALLAIDEGLFWGAWDPSEIKDRAYDNWQSYEASDFPSVKTMFGAIRTLDSLREWYAPWSAMVIGLSLLSAYLILWKPRKNTAFAQEPETSHA